MKTYIILIFSLLLTACASTSYDNELYNTINNYEVVFVNGKITKTSEMALKQIKNTETIKKIEVTMFRSDQDDLKSLMKANSKKKEVSDLLNNKDVVYIYNPKKESKDFFLKVLD